MLDSFDNDTLCSNNFGDSQGPQAMAFRRLSKRNSGTTVGPTFYHRRSRSHDQGTFYIHCRLEVIPAAGTVAWANSLIPSAETLDREATAPTCISQNLSPLWTRSRQGSHRCQHVAIDVVWNLLDSLRMYCKNTVESVQ